MTIFKSAANMAGTLLAILQTRVELAAIELQESAHRFLFYFILAIGALFCAMMAFLLLILLVIVLFWDIWRVGIIFVLAAIFGGAALALGLGLRNSIRNRPGLLAYTRSELAKDIEHLKKGR